MLSVDQIKVNRSYLIHRNRTCIPTHISYISFPFRHINTWEVVTSEAFVGTYIHLIYISTFNARIFSLNQLIS